MYFIFKRINGFVGVQKRKSGTASVNSKQEACFARAPQVWLAVNHNTNEFDVRSELHGTTEPCSIAERSESLSKDITPRKRKQIC